MHCSFARRRVSATGAHARQRLHQRFQQRAVRRARRIPISNRFEPGRPRSRSWRRRTARRSRRCGSVTTPSAFAWRASPPRTSTIIGSAPAPRAADCRRRHRAEPSGGGGDQRRALAAQPSPAIRRSSARPSRSTAARSTSSASRRRISADSTSARSSTSGCRFRIRRDGSDDRGNRGVHDHRPLAAGARRAKRRRSSTTLAARLARDYPKTNLGTLERPYDPRPMSVRPASRIDPSFRGQVMMLVGRADGWRDARAAAGVRERCEPVSRAGDDAQPRAGGAARARRHRRTPDSTAR